MSRPGEWERKYRRLQKAVVALYSQAMWLPDRYVENESEYWEELRDAAGIEPGTKNDMFWSAIEQRRREEEEK